MLQSKALIYKYFKAFADAHQTIERIGFEFEEQLENFAGEDKDYPILFVSPLDSPTIDNRGLREMGFRIHCLDIIQTSDRSNIKNIVNKTDLILYDFLQFFNQNGDSEIYVQGQPIIVPVNNHLTDYTTGHYIDVLIQSKTTNSCGAPMVGYTPPPSGECDDAINNINQSDGTFLQAVSIPSGDTANTNIADSVITVNTTELSVNVKATDGKNFNLLDLNGNPIGVNSVSGDNVTLNTWWSRPTEWLEMPTITASDNKFAGLYAVFEDDAFNNTLTIQMPSGFVVDLGDGSTLTTTTGIDQHSYDYATISGVVLVSDDGRNYKQVMVQIDLTGLTSSINLARAITGEVFKTSGWLDIIASCSTMTNIVLFRNTERYAKYIQRLLILNSNTAVTNDGHFRYCSSLRILQFPLNTISLNASIFLEIGNVRLNQSTPISINNLVSTNFSAWATRSKITELGDLSFEAGTICPSLFLEASIEKVLSLNVPSATRLDRSFEYSRIRNLGTITVTTALTNISKMFFASTDINSIVFAGDMSEVTNTGSAFDGNISLTRLILPNITIGFDIRDSRVTGTNLQDLFNSLGTASGAQTITLPSFTSGESTAIATGKGYTIAYA